MPTPSFILPTSVPVVDASVEALRVYDGSPAGFDVLPMSFTRASTATRTDSAGNVVSAVPYNIFTYSEQLENILWLKNNITITANADTAPNGLVVADSYLSSVTVGPHPCYQSNVLPSNTYTYSVYAKKVNSRYISLKGAGGRFIWAGVIFDLDTATVVSIQNNNIPGVTGNVSSVGGGWYRISMTATSNFNDFGLQYASSPSNTFGDYGDLVIAGSGVVDYMLWGTQAVVGTQPLPYQETVTRLALPRLDYRNADGTLSSTPRLLLEPQRTNLVTFSEQFSNAAWININSTVTSNSTVSPDGYQNADTIASNSAAEARLMQSKSATSSTVYSGSVFVKKDNNESRFPEFYLRTESTAYNEIYVQLNTKTGASVIRLQNGTASKSVDSYGDYWRVNLTLTNTVDTTIILGIRPAATNVIGTYNPQIGSIITYGAQLEAGTYPTTYIPTTTAAVTRLADTCSLTGASSVIGQTEGTLFVDVEYANIDTSDQAIITLFQNSTNRFGIGAYRSGVSNYFQFYCLSSSSVTVNINTIRTSGRYKMAGAYKNNDWVFYINGTQIGVDTSSPVPTASDLYIGTSATFTASFGNGINKAALYPTRLSDDELQSLTTL
jgi:hypothetical protein